MQRLTIALLAALDAAIAAAVGLAVLLAPLTLLWVIALGGTADWGTLWPTTSTLWQFGHGVPVQVSIPDAIVVATGISPKAAHFALSLTPLALLLFTLIFAVRSGRRAARAGAWLSGVLGGAIAFAILSAVIGLSAGSSILRAELWAGIIIPLAVYVVGLLIGAVSAAWIDGDGGLIDRIHDRVDDWGLWSPVPASALRGAAIALTAVLAVSALGIAVMVVLRGGEVVALFQASRSDALGATVLTLGHLAYLPTLIVWTASWIAVPGFALGTGTSVSPVGTNVGVVPGIPVLGLIPEGGSIWMLIVVLLPIAAGALAGWMVRSRLVWEDADGTIAVRAAIAGGIGVLTAGVAAVFAVLASGGIGPGRLADTGPQPVIFALALGGEVLLGAAILLLAPRNRDDLAEERTDRYVAEMGALPTRDADISENVTEPLDDFGFSPDRARD